MRYLLFMKKIMLIYAIVILTLTLAITPVYLNALNLSKENVRAETLKNFETSMKVLELELDNMFKIGSYIEADMRYIMLSDQTDTKNVEIYSDIVGFSRYYRSLVAMNTYITDMVLVFHNNDMAIMKDFVFSNAAQEFDAFFSFDSMDFKQFKHYLYSNDNAGKFKYDDALRLKDEIHRAILYFMPVGRKGNSCSYIIAVIQLDSFLDAIGIAKDLDKINVSVKDKQGNVLFANSDKEVNAWDEKILSYTCDRTGLTFSLDLTERYISYKVRPFTSLIRFYFAFIFVLGFVLAVIMFRVYCKPIKKIMNLIGKKGDSYDIDMEAGYAQVFDALQDMNRQIIYYDDMVSKNYLSRFFTSPLAESETKSFCERFKIFKEPFIMIVFKLSFKLEMFEDILKKFSLGDGMIASDNYGNVVLFLPHTDGCENVIKERASKIISYVRDMDLQIKIVVSQKCETALGGYGCYKEALELLRFLDYEFFISASEVSSKSYHTLNTARNKKIKALILDGNAFEANRLIYKQWYEIIENKIRGNFIEQTFFEQRGMLAEVASETGCSITLPMYNELCSINDLAFMITDAVNELVEFISLRLEENPLGSKMLDYIDENCTDINFGLSCLEEEFNVSAKTASKVVKKSSGHKFSDYVKIKRVEKAKKLLVSSEESIKKIAELCGFGTENSFYRTFRDVVGVSPGAYRKIHKSESNVYAEKI